MQVLDKYTNQKKIDDDQAKKPEEQTHEKEKILLGNDAFAVCEMVSSLIRKIEQLRINLLK
jgi:hypothetical protein